MGDIARTGADSYFKMNLATWLSLLLGVITIATPALSSEPRVVCYYTNWSVYRPGTARFNPQNINPYLCTHLIYAFGGFTKDNTLKPFDKYQDIEKGGYAKFTGLKTYNKNLKTMLAIGGWNEGSSRFSPMVASRERRKEFVRNAIKFLRQNRFDGLDLDWEYPAFRDGGKPKDRENYARLVKELREEFDREAEKTNKPRLLLTMAVPAGIEYIQKGFDVKTLNTYLDWMNLLTYDYHSAFEPAVNHHAPLYPLEEPNEYSVDTELNIDYTIKFYLENGADRDKLVLGIPTYGRSYTLFNSDAVEIGSPADGPGEQGDATREKGYLAYYEICEALKPKDKKRSVSDEESEEYAEEEEEEWTIMHPNPDAMGPVAFKGNQWVGYDDVDIVKKKAEYVAENGLGGIMFWSIDNDDFRGTCHSKPYPLIEAAKEAYVAKLGSTDTKFLTATEKPRSAGRPNRRRNKPKVASSTTLKPATKASNKRSSTTPAWNVTPEPPTTPDPGADFKCKDEGFFPHPRDCKKYFWCLDSGPSNLGIVAHQFTCPSGLFFNKAADSCDFARNVLCKTPTTTAKPPTKAAKTTQTSTSTTTRKPVKLSTKNTALFRTSTTTTIPEPEEEQEYEEVEETFDEDAEDPKVIKELIDLIKKVGGVEQLEKQLHRAETLTSSTDGGRTTPATFNKKLYQKVLERAKGNKFTGNNVSQNSRSGPQNQGIEPAANKKTDRQTFVSKDRSLNKDRPQYTTIQRNRPPTTGEPLDSQESEAPVPYRARAVEPEDTGTTAKSLQYVNIRRARPTDAADDTASRNALFERAESYISVSEQPSSIDIASARRENQPEYVTIRRQRPTTVEATTVQYEEADSQVDVRETALEREISSQPQYTSIVRARSTTLSPPEPIETTVPPTKATTSIEESSPEPTTVLSVQISSLLNSPSSAEETAAPETTVAQTTEAEVATTTSSTTRRPAIRRRGSTTTTAAPASSTTQVSPRNYSFISRRRQNQNEISDSDKDIELSRRIRSTTPDSREVDAGTTRRFRSRYQTPTDDSATAAASPVASPVSRGQFRPRLNADDLISLTPVDVEPQFVPRQALSQRQERRFRGRTTAADSLDSEASAATVEAQRPFVPRGRGRFGFSTSTTEAATTPEATEATPSPRRPTFARFSPRPFARASTPAPTTPEDNKDVNVQSVTQNAPPRLPFGRTRAAPSTTVSPAARRLPFRSRGTTPQSLLFNESDDDELESKIDDIFLSESAIEEKEHEEDVTEIPKRRVVVKKLRTPVTTETSPTESIPIDESESGKRKFRIIRRRPVSTITPIETEATTEAATPQRIRKVIRKKINKIVEDEPEIIAKSIGSLESAKTTIAPATDTAINYGERKKVTTVIATTPTTPSAEQVTDKTSEEISEVITEEKVIKENNNGNEADKNEQVEISIVKEEKVEKDENTQGSENTEEDKKPDIVVESEQQAIDSSENKETSDAQSTTQAEEKLTEITTVSSTTLTSTARSRIPYRPNKRIFTSTTEAAPSSSKTFSRKFNPGVYTSPASVSTRAPPAFRPAGARRPAFSQFTRRPFTTARTTTRLEEEEEEEYSDEEILDEEPENPSSFVPSGQLYSRKPSTDDEDLDNGSEEEEYEEEPENPFVATTKSSFRPKVVNSNTFRTSTSTTELPKRLGSQNKTALYNRFPGIKPVNEIKKRVQNVPQGYVAPDAKANQTIEEQKKDISTAAPTTEYETTPDDDYLSMSDPTTTLRDSTNTETLSTVDAETSTFQMDISTDDYLENTEPTTYYPSTQDVTTNTQTTKLQNTVVYTDAITEKSEEATTSAPIIKTQFDKLFSVSRVVEVSSKLDKHRLNKNNETTLIEEGQVMVEKKPVVDKIGEVSRFSFIKILENEIPIYLTKLGHVYPVENPPDNLIRIDEARNARALTSYTDPLRENLVASESINEAYRHITKISKVPKNNNTDKRESEVERLPSDGFLSFINEDKKSETLQVDPLFAQWQFVPAAYENEQTNLKKDPKSSEVITPRTMRNDPSTLSLEGLFRTDMPITAQKVSEDKNQPFVVYSSPVSQQEDVNIVKLEVLKPETGRSIITSAKGQEFNGGFTPENAITKSPISVSIVPKTESATEVPSTTPSTTTITTTEAIKTSPLVEMLSTQATETEATTTDEPLTTVTDPEETTTVTVSPLEAKRAKYGFPRRPIIKSSNSTRYNVPRTVAKKPNATVTVNLVKKVNKTTTFTPNKSRFAVARAQNVPVDIRKKINNRLTTRVFTTEPPRTTTERKLYFKPIRSTFRPAFVPRKNTQAQVSDDS